MNKGVKFRIYPNGQQRQLIEKTFGCCRLIYNMSLDMRKKAYLSGTKCGYAQTSAFLTSMKQSTGYEFLKEVDSIALQQSLRDLDRGFSNFFQKRARYPIFKSKHISHQSYRTVNQNSSIRICSRHIRLPKLGWVKVRQSMPVDKINHATIVRTPTGKYFVVLNVEFEPKHIANLGGSIGIDVGIKSFYTDSLGRKVSNPRYLEKALHMLTREQRKLSRRTEGSSNYRRQKRKVARIHERICNQRNDFLQKQSTMLISENQTICIESLHVKNMVKNRRLAQHIASVSWSRFYTMLQYKAEWYGNDIISIPAMYPSSQTCSSCGYKNPEVKKLSIRRWECPQCHTEHDRDINASINILNIGLRLAGASI